ncbi:FAD binding domain-containing protein [Dissophora ornata]|nr:hypothetical protein BGZ58_010515 [Dissophora ornata]KAI8602846.1 FAD binding domain-containing protein [Dissophora ornata]
MATATATAGSSSSSTKSSSSSSRSSISTVPVLIAGGGPVGLFEAYLLTKLGIPVRVIEREMSISPLSKALGIQARSLEIFQMAGIVDKFLERGRPLTDFNIYIGTKKVAILPVLGGQNTHYSFGLFLEQAKTSEILVEELEKMGVKVDHGWELLDTKVVEGDAQEGAEPQKTNKTYVETTIRRALSGDNTAADEKKVIGDVNPFAEQDDKEYEYQVVRSEYLVAADGGRSTVRHKLNIEFPGRTLDHKTMMWDGTCECDVEFQGVTFIHGVNNKTMMAFPLANGNIRVSVEAGDMEPGEDLSKTLEGLSVEKFEELASAIVAPNKFKVKETGWLTIFKINERRAEHFVHQNRIFLAGDAAHVHSPAGGQGMNTGLQDAHNLAWKLAFVINGVAPESLLETYEEREPMADRAIALSSKLLQNNRRTGYVFQMLRRVFYAVAPLVIAVGRTFSYAPEVSMLNVRYQENALNKAHATQPVPYTEFQVGARAQDGLLRPLKSTTDMPEETAQLRVHELTAGIGRFQVLVFTSDMLASVRGTAVAIQGINTTNAKELEYNIESYMSRWRTKWSYGSNMQDGHHDKDLFKIHIIAGSVTASENSKSLDALASKSVGDGRVYMDNTKEVHQRYGLGWSSGAGGIVVIRPDSHIGFRVNGAGEQAWEDVHEYFSSILAL